MLIKEEALRNKIKFLLEKKYLKNNDKLLEIILEGKVDTAIAKAESSFVSDEAKNYFKVEIKNYIEEKLKTAGLLKKSHLYIPIFMSLSTQGGNLKDIDTSSSDFTKHMQDLKQIMPCVLNNPTKFDMNILRSRSDSLKEFYQYITSVLGRIPNNDSCEPPVGRPGAHNTVSYQPVSFTASELRDIYASVIPNVHKRFEKKPTRTGDKTSIVYDADGIMVVRPESPTASCYLGSRGTWCIARPKNTMYDNYEEKWGGQSRHFYFVKNFDHSVKDGTGHTSDVCLQFVYHPKKRYEGFWTVDDTLHMPSAHDIVQSVPIIDGNNPEMIAIYKNQVSTYGFDSDDYTQGVVSLYTTPGLVMLVNSLRNTGLFPGEKGTLPDEGKSFEVALAVLTHLFGTERFSDIISPKSLESLKIGALGGTPEERKTKREKVAAERREKRIAALENAKKILSQFSLEGSEELEVLSLAIQEYNDVVGSGISEINKTNQEFKRSSDVLVNMFSDLELPENFSPLTYETVSFLNMSDSDMDNISNKAALKIADITYVRSFNAGSDKEFGKLLIPLFTKQLKLESPRETIKDAVSPVGAAIASFLKRVSRSPNVGSRESDFNDFIKKIEDVLINVMSLTLLKPEFLTSLELEVYNQAFQTEYYAKKPKDLKNEIPRLARKFVAIYLKSAVEFAKDIIMTGSSKDTLISVPDYTYSCTQAIKLCKLQTSLINKLMLNNALSETIEIYRTKTLPQGLDDDIENSIKFVEKIADKLSTTSLGNGYNLSKTITFPRGGNSVLSGKIKVEMDVVNFQRILKNTRKLIQDATNNYAEKIFLARFNSSGIKSSLKTLTDEFNYSIRNRGVERSVASFEGLIDRIVSHSFSKTSPAEHKLLMHKVDDKDMFSSPVASIGNLLGVPHISENTFYIAGKEVLKLDLSSTSPDERAMFRFIMMTMTDTVNLGEMRIEIDANIDVPVFPDFPNQPFPFIDQQTATEYDSSYNSFIAMATEDSGHGPYGRIQGGGYDAFEDEEGNPAFWIRPNPISIYTEIVEGDVNHNGIVSLAGSVYDRGSATDQIFQGKDKLVPKRIKEAIIAALIEDPLYYSGFSQLDVDQENPYMSLFEVQSYMEEHLNQNRTRIQISDIEQTLNIDLTGLILASFLSNNFQQQDILSILATIHSDTVDVIQNGLASFVSAGRGVGVTRQAQQKVINDINNMLTPQDWYDAAEEAIEAFAEDNPDSFYY